MNEIDLISSGGSDSCEGDSGGPLVVQVDR